jgi:hypothetical protein
MFPCPLGTRCVTCAKLQISLQVLCVCGTSSLILTISEEIVREQTAENNV